MITADSVKSTLKSLKAKINKETGKEHETIAEGVETLVLGYGAGDTEPWDGNIIINGEIEKDVLDYYEEGRKAGLSEAGRIIYGAFILDAIQTPVVAETVILSEPIYVYANFYGPNGYTKEKINSLTVSPSGELVSIYNFDRTKFIKYMETDEKWICGNGDVIEDLPDAIGRIIEFTEPVAVAAALFDVFDDISSTNIEDTVISMVDQRLINVSEEGL